MVFQSDAMSSGLRYSFLILVFWGKRGIPVNYRRIVSLILALLMLFHISLSAFAENAENAAAESGLQKHTVTITAGDRTGKPMPLSSAGTTMDDQGDYLQNAEGVVQTQVQSVYHANQKLVSVSLAGTSFSFSPQMLDSYDPQPVETVSPEPSATPEASAAPEHTSEPNTMSTPTDMLPVPLRCTETVPVRSCPISPARVNRI